MGEALPARERKTSPFNMMTFSHRACLAAAVATIGASVYGCRPTYSAPIEPARARLIDARVQRLLEQYHTPGASVEVTTGGKVAYAAVFGQRNVGRRLPANLTTAYEIGSITKQFTAAAILQLQEAGKLDIDARLATYLPHAPHASEVTLRQLLAHTSGMPEYFSCDSMPPSTTPDALIGSIAGKPLDFTPGTRWRYSNTGYILLGRVIEVTSGESYNHYVRAHLLEPSDMTQTHTVADVPRIVDVSLGYLPTSGAAANGPATPAPTLIDSYGWSAGNIVSTVGDLQKWNAALAGGRIISARSYELMRTSATTSDGTVTNYGFGLFVDSLEDQPRIGHTGHSCGFAAEDEYFPRQDMRIVVLTNSVDGPAESIVTVLLNSFFPEFAASADEPGVGEEPAMTARIKALITPLLHGHVVRSELTADENADLTDEAAKEFTKYGEPGAFVFKRKVDRPFGPVYIYWLKFGDDVQRLVVQIERKTDKFNAIAFATPSEFGAKR